MVVITTPYNTNIFTNMPKYSIIERIGRIKHLEYLQICAMKCLFFSLIVVRRRAR